MRIGIDARFYGPIGKGLGRYTARLIEHLERILPEGDECIVFLRRENFDAYHPGCPRFRKVLADYPWYSFREQVLFPILLGRHRLDLVHFPHFNVPLLYRRPFVVTVHDLILLRYPTVRNTTRSVITYRLKFFAYRLVIGSAVRRARRVLTVSRFTERDIVREYPVAAGKIVVAYEGCDLPKTDPAGEDDAPVHDILEPYFLYVGNAYPHKNLEAFIPLSGKFPDIRFVLVGREDHFYGRLKTLVKASGADNVVFLGSVPDGTLVRLYEGARALVSPSLYEGFGLPALEAMRLGTPVIAAARGSFPEVLGDAALFFDPDREGDLERAVGMLSADPRLADDLSRRGCERSAGFRWDRLAKVTLRTYTEALAD